VKEHLTGVSYLFYTTNV